VFNVKKFALGFILLLILCSVLATLPNIVTVEASGTIYIRADGTVEGTDKIQRDGNVYTFTDNVNDSIVVEKNNVVVDGAGYILQGTGNGIGIDLSERNNTTIRNMEINRFYYGIWLDMSSENSISGNNITNNEVGIDLNQSSNNSIYGNDMMNNWRGTSFWHSSNNSIYGNNVTNNDHGIWIGESSNFNSISENNVTNNDHGIWLDYSSNNTLRGNSMTNNGYNFGVWGESLSDFVNDVDASNTVDGEPVYYWIEMRDVAVPLDAGYVALINCINITVQDLNLIKNRQGVLLAYTTNSTITRNNLASNWHGVWLWYSSNNNISGDNITNNELGIRLINSSRNNVTGNNLATNNDEGIYIWGSSNNTVAGNTMINNWRGISLWYSSNNSIYKNNITANNFDGIILWYSADNKFYDNNFIHNTHQVFIPILGYANFWNDGYPSGGNYWSDFEDRYPGVEDIYSGPNQNETGSDGIWDHPYVIDENNQDNYPVVPEFPTWTSILLIIIVLTVALAIYKRARGNSLKITVPVEVARHLGIGKGDTVDLWVDNNHIIVEKKKS